MENFVVSARKYRPDTFDTVVGQQAITTTLKNAIKNNHIAQSFLFCGPRGVGKTTCARILAKTINCENRTEEVEACGQCESCRGFQENASQNIYELDAASNRSVEAMRTLVEQVRIPPQVGKYKVYIIDEVHMLTSEAFNAFLKTLEEPPAYAKFILATTEKHKIIPTILSRCQIFDFKRIKSDDIVSHLKNIAEKEGITAEEEGLRIIAEKSDGGLRDALSMFDQIVSFSGNSLTYAQVISMLNILDYDYFFSMVDYFLQGGRAQVLNLFNTVLENGFDAQNFLLGLSKHFRSLMLAKDFQSVPLMEVSSALKQRYVEQALKCSPEQLLRALNLCNTADLNYRQSNHKRLSIEILLLDLCGIFFLDPDSTMAQTKVPPVVTVQPAAPEKVPQSAPVAARVQPQPDRTGSVSAVADSTQEHRNKRSVLSIKGLVSEKVEPVQEKEVPEEDKDFDENLLNHVWKWYRTSVTDQSGPLNVVLKDARIRLEPDYKVVLTVNGEVMKGMVLPHHKEILAYLVENLQNHRICLEIEAEKGMSDENALNPALYSVESRFDLFRERNPEIGNFREKLHLDIGM